MDKKAIILTGVGFAVGVGEALIYYNMGQAGGNKFSFRMPPTREFIKTAAVVLLTSVVTTALFKGIEMAFEPVEQQVQVAENKKT